MRDHDPKSEAEFFAVFAAYFDLETSAGRAYSAEEYTLARMAPLAALAGNPERHLKIVHVAGTKGKGSTCFFCAALLRASGRGCGTFTSPHLATVRERFQINGEPIAYPVLLRAAREFEAELRRAGLRPPLFEIMTLLAMRLFVAAGCEFAILETGIGGLLDATNYIPAPLCCAITPVSFDHTQVLGNTIAAIAAQKAGIIKPGVPVVCAGQPFPEAAAVIRRQAESLQAPLHGPAEVADFAIWGLAGAPAFLRENFAVALRVSMLLGITPEAARFRPPRLPGRCEQVRAKPLVVLDAAHNADSAKRLVQAMDWMYPGEKFTVVLGVVKGKDVAGILDALGPWAAELLLTHPRTPKPSALDELAALAAARGLPHRLLPGITSVADLPAGRNLLFTGSFFTALIGEDLFC